MGKIFTISTLFLLGFLHSGAQYFDRKHNPGLDMNLSPAHNSVIHPDHNSSINPKLNWNVNPYKNGLINPDKIAAINPRQNKEMNPMENPEMNPMFTLNISPKYEYWHGLYVFDSSNNLIGYVTQYSQDIIIQFDKDSKLSFFYVRTAKGTYNQFTLDANWTGNFLVFDSMTGFNLFDKECTWTGWHIK